MIKVNLGCGRNVIAGWRNYDLVDHPDVIKRDLALPLPHVDNSVEFVNMERLIEQMTRSQALTMLIEVHRMLKPNGVLRISTPDLKILLWNYSKGNLWGIPGVWEPKSICQMVNEGMSEFSYDEAELRLILEEAGFNMIFKKHWRQSEHPDLKGLEVRPFNGEVILEATK